MKVLLTLLLTSILLVTTGCQETSEEVDSNELKIVTSLSIIADMTEEIAGDKAEVNYIVPLGEEPEEYEPTPSDFQEISDADVFFINGYNIEAWLEQVTENVTDVDVIPIAEEGPKIPLEGTDDIPDPHLWLNPLHVRDYYVDKIVTTLKELDSENSEYYQEKADEYIEELEELDKYIEEETNKIPEDNRLIITSEHAFKYYGDRYGFDTNGIWELNAHEEGTPQQIANIIDLVNESEVPAVFAESTVDPRYMENISDETGVELAKEVYTDAIGDEETNADSYINMMKESTKVIVENLK
ncbi:metal ABC transporter solute-binding protein, Zn/Mn family [Natranaerobius trueperi]|uniref:Metal ABC transporter substrate-binding protein n=1 Tax=Natranaerobius trueperi TaxID=759412 RepID=A0A226C162_9FIRM|nr:zinc ABC transporter substrate-binding protein [Natranaerobius trueperi]OWZ85003.1 metal ABC transporter substrate-binding protein [Natranaerobius trueperi]